MKDLILVTLGKNKYGIWQDEAPTVKDIKAIHWLPPVPKHIAGLCILDGLSVTLFDLPACVGLSPITKEKQCYPTLLLKHEKNNAGFIVNFVIGHFAIQPEAVYPMPDFLQTPIIDTCVMYDSEPIPVINISKLFKRVQNVGFEPCVAELRICKAKSQKISSAKSGRVFECGGETFAVSEAHIEQSVIKLGRTARPALLPPYVSGITFHNEKMVSLIHLSKRMKLAINGSPELMLISDIEGQIFGLLVDSDRGRWHANDSKLKPLPPLVQGDWMQGAVLSGKEIIPILEPGGLISNHTDGLAGNPLPQRYTPSSQFKSIFGNEDVQVCEFSLLSARHALPRYEVEDQFKVKPYRSLPNVMSIVIGVALHAEQLLPVLDLAACFGRRSLVTPDWQMLLVKSGNFRALVLTEAIFGERLLPVKMHRGLPFEEPHSLVYGCYPEKATVRLILNVEALAVYFDKSLFKEFFTTLSKEIALEPMDIGLKPEPEETEVGWPAQKAKEPLEKGIEPVKFAAAEKLFAPEKPPSSIALTAAIETEERREIKETAEIAPPGIAAAAADSEETSSAQDNSAFQEARKIAEIKAEGTHFSVSEDYGPEPEPEVAELGRPTPKVKEQPEGGIEPVTFTETEKRSAPEEPPTLTASIEVEEAEEKREIKETAEVASPDIATAVADSEKISAEKKTDFQATQKFAKTKVEGTYVAVSEAFGSESQSDVEQEEQVDEIIELTEFVGIEEIIELTELIEAEEASVPNVLTSTANTVLPDAEGVSGNPETDACEKPQKKFTAGVFVTVLLIGLITVTLFSSGIFKTWMVDKKNKKTGAFITATQPLPEKPKTSLPPKSKKPPAVSKGPKLAEVQKGSAETPAASAIPEPSPAKHRRPPALRTATATPSDSKITRIEKVNSREPAAVEAHGPVPAIGLKQAAPRMSSPESTDIAIHNVEKGDTLWNISKRYTGTGFNYPHLAKENEITNPDLIFIKQKVRVSKKYGIKEE